MVGHGTTTGRAGPAGHVFVVSTQTPLDNRRTMNDSETRTTCSTIMAGEQEQGARAHGQSFDLGDHGGSCELLDNVLHGCREMVLGVVSVSSPSIGKIRCYLAVETARHCGRQTEPRSQQSESRDERL